jgi:hypothetical protein
MSVASPVQETLDEHSDRPSLQHREEHSTDPAREADSKDFEDWLDLPMLVKLDSMHALIEWQFQKPLRLRAIMKNDDEVAEWVSSSPYICVIRL